MGIADDMAPGKIAEIHYLLVDDEEYRKTYLVRWEDRFEFVDSLCGRDRSDPYRDPEHPERFVREVSVTGHGPGGDPPDYRYAEVEVEFAELWG